MKEALASMAALFWLCCTAVLVICTGAFQARYRRTAIYSDVPVNEHLSRRQREAGSQLTAILEKLNSLDERVTSLAGKIGDLHRQMGRILADRKLDGVVDDLKEVCKELANADGGREDSGNETTLPSSTDLGINTPNTTPTTVPELENSGHFHLTKVTRELMENVFIITVYYESPVKPTVKERQSNFGKFHPVEHTHFGKVEVEKQRALPNKELSLLFEVPDYSVIIDISLDEKSPSEENLTDLYLHLSTGNDVIYAPGKDIDVKLVVNKTKEDNETGTLYVHCCVAMASETKRDTVDVHCLHPEYRPTVAEFDIQYNQTVSPQGLISSSIHIPYNKDRLLQGVVTFVIVIPMPCSLSICLVQPVIAYTRVAFYPEGLNGPFPENFVGFQRRQREQEEPGTEPAVDTVNCATNSEHEQCLVMCSVMGDEPTVDIVDIRTGRPSGFYHVETNSGDFYATASIDLVNVTEEDSGQFMCSARSRKGPSISMPITVTVRRSAHILRNLSTAWKLPNGSLEAVCVAEGKPLPRVSFTHPIQGEIDAMQGLEKDEYFVTEAPINDTVAQARLLIPLPSDAMYFVECYATNAPSDRRWDYDREYLYLDDN